MKSSKECLRYYNNWTNNSLRKEIYGVVNRIDLPWKYLHDDNSNDDVKLDIFNDSYLSINAENDPRVLAALHQSASLASTIDREIISGMLFDRLASIARSSTISYVDVLRCEFSRSWPHSLLSCYQSILAQHSSSFKDKFEYFSNSPAMNLLECENENEACIESYVSFKVSALQTVLKFQIFNYSSRESELIDGYHCLSRFVFTGN